MAMVLVVDKSGSMQGMPIALARQAAKASAELLGPRDQIAIIAFDGAPFTIVEMTFAVDRIIAGGGTNMYPAMELGRQALDSTTAKVKHMIILTDGMSMPGDFHGLANEMAEQNMTVSTVALGNSADRALLKSIADIGRGRYYQTTDPDTVPRIFSKETVEASRSAIHEEPFTPIRIAEADMLEGIDFDQAPFLLGYVMSRSKLTAKTLLLTETGDPLLATARFGLGVSLAFTSDASGTWASEWLRWSGFGKFWAQALRSCLRKSDSSGILISSEESAAQTRYRISRKDSAGTLLNALQWEAIMLDQDGRRHLIPVNQVGLGLYEARVDTPQVGRYTLRFHDKLNAKTKIIHHHQDYPAEYRLSNKPSQAFDSLNRLSSEKIFQGLDPAVTKQPLQNPLLVAAILCFIIGVLLKRI